MICFEIVNNQSHINGNCRKNDQYELFSMIRILIKISIEWQKLIIIYV